MAWVVLGNDSQTLNGTEPSGELGTTQVAGSYPKA
jgi:hypothetical protein